MVPSPLAACFFPALYVAPFYLWRDLPRSHPKSIWRRMIASAVVTLSAAWVPTWLSLQPGQAEHGLPKLLGLRVECLPAALTLPLALTAVLFAGPLYMLALDWRCGTPPASRIPAGPAALRNLVAAPITEEFTFRSCLMSFLLARGVAPSACIFLSPLAFGAAHLHHLYDLVRFQGWPLRQACLAVLLQLTYTTVFGWYAAFLLLRTGSLPVVALVHAFCNFMGLPPLQAITRYPHPRRIAVVFLAGVAAFLCLLGPLTDPALYWRGRRDYRSLFTSHV